MQERISQASLADYCPRLATHLIGLGKTPAGSAISVGLKHLVKLRVSQINGCGFCQHMHAQEARQDGDQQGRLDLLPAWREAPCFSEKERAALAWAEALTLLASNAISEGVYKEAVDQFGEADLIELTTVVLEINSWNRVAVGFRLLPDMAVPEETK